MDDYLLRYQVGITQIGCSTYSGKSQGQGFRKGQVVVKGAKGFSRANKWVRTDALVVAPELEPVATGR